MKVLEANAGLLSNFEVMDLLRKRGADKGPLSGSISVGECKVYDYLAETAAGTQTRTAIEAFMSEVDAFHLTKAEKLQSVNLRPSTAVEAHLVVEDCDERLSNAQVERFIACVAEVLPEPPSRPEQEEDVMEEDGEEEMGEETEQTLETNE